MQSESIGRVPSGVEVRRGSADSARVLKLLGTRTPPSNEGPTAIPPDSAKQPEAQSDFAVCWPRPLSANHPAAAEAKPDGPPRIIPSGEQRVLLSGKGTAAANTLKQDPVRIRDVAILQTSPIRNPLPRRHPYIPFEAPSVGHFWTGAPEY